MLASLIQTPRAPFVPEKLRKLLRDTESLPSERVLPRAGDRNEQMFVNRVILRKPPPPKVTLLPKRKRKMRQNGYKDISYEEEKGDIPPADKVGPLEDSSVGVSFSHLLRRPLRHTIPR